MPLAWRILSASINPTWSLRDRLRFSAADIKFATVAVDLASRASDLVSIEMISSRKSAGL